MSQENVEAARRLYPGTFDLVPLLDAPQLVESYGPLVHPEFETVGDALAMGVGADAPEATGERRAAHGMQGFLDIWHNALDAWESWVVSATEFIDVDDERVLVLLDVHARSRTHGVEVPIPGGNLLTFREGKVTRLELFSSRAEALEAAGLSE